MDMDRCVSVLALSCLVACGGSEVPRKSESVPDVAATTPAWVAVYRGTAGRIKDAAMENEDGWQKLQFLADNIGHRLSGSKSLEAAIQWAAATMKSDMLKNVRVQPVMVPNWKRGAESAGLTQPIARQLHITTLGNSVGTKGTLRAPVVIASSFDDLEKLGTSAKGAIVLFNHKMPPYSEEHGSGYGEASQYRVGGPSKAAKVGAAAVLVRSLTAHSLQSPHTGTLYYDEKIKKIPAAAVSVEDAELIERLLKGGKKVEVSLSLGAKMLPDAKSGNVIGELVGSELPHEIVLLGAHIDSWDVGQGAHDDGTGCVIMMEAVALLQKLGLRPKRTIRVVLFTNEENGGRGAKEYAARADAKNHVMAIESDGGGFAPLGFSVQGSGAAISDTRAISSLLATLGVREVEKGFSGADIYALGETGVPALGLRVEGSKYFDYHHTEADTLDKVDPKELQMNIAAVATLAFVVADMPRRFGKGGQ